MKVFLTGCTGYIGKQTALAFARQGHELVLLYRNQQPKELAAFNSIQWIKGDLSSIEKLQHAMQGCDVVIHMAAFAKIWSKNPNETFEVNVEGTKNMLEAALQAGVHNFIYTASAGAFGSQLTKHELISENRQSKGKLHTEYEKSKEQAIALVKEYASKGMRTISLCPTRVYGPGDLSDSNQGTKIIKKYLEGTWRFKPGSGASIGNYVYVDDVVQAHLLALTKGNSGHAYIIGGNENVSYNQFFNLVGQCIGVQRIILPMPLSILLLYGIINEWFSALFNVKPIITRPWLRKYSCNWACDISKAKQELHFEAIALQDGIQKTIDWLKAQNNSM
jgi:nucleoside-diphosphate-sugar epimerase